MEKQLPGRVEELAYHFARSANDERAVHYLIAAAVQASSSYLNSTALDYTTAAMGRAGELDGELSVAARAELHGVRGEILERMAKPREAAAEFRSALALGVDEPLREIRLTTLLGRSLRLRGDFESAHEAYRAATDLIESSPDRDELPYRRAAIDIGNEESSALYFGGRDDELPEHNEALRPLVERYGTLGAADGPDPRRSAVRVSAASLRAWRPDRGFGRTSGRSGTGGS